MNPPVGTITYTVTATFPDEATRSRFIRWLLDDHIAKICAKGALSGTVVRLSDPAQPLRTETRYLFPNPETLATYLSHHAPALRAEGLAAVPAGVGCQVRPDGGGGLWHSSLRLAASISENHALDAFRFDRIL
jgi:hypothetical protein